MTLSGGKIHRLIESTARWADWVGDKIQEASDNEDQPLRVDISIEAMKSLEETLIMCEDVIKNAAFTIQAPDD